MQNNFVVPSRKIHHTILSHRALASSVGINPLCLASRHGASSYGSTAFSKVTSNNCTSAFERQTKATRSLCLKLAFFMLTVAGYISIVFTYCSKRASHRLDNHQCVLCSWGDERRATVCTGCRDGWIFLWASSPQTKTWRLINYESLGLPR